MTPTSSNPQSRLQATGRWLRKAYFPPSHDGAAAGPPQSLVRRLLAALDQLIVLGFVSVVASLTGWVVAGAWIVCTTESTSCNHGAFTTGITVATFFPILTGVATAALALVKVAQGSSPGRWPFAGCIAAVASPVVGLSVANASLG